MTMPRSVAAYLAVALLCLSVTFWARAVMAEVETPPDLGSEIHPDLRIEQIRKIFNEGEFARAAAEARQCDAPGADALAARAALSEGDFHGTPATRRKIFLAAEADARRAIARDPQDPEGHLYLALALGFLGRVDGTLVAHFAGYADEARREIDEALKLDPQSAWAHALDGGWNLEILRDGGVIGERIYGASPEKGIAAFRKALTLQPDNAAIAYQFALQLLAIGGVVHRAEAYRVLVRSLEPKEENAVERLARQRARRLKLTLDTHDDLAMKFILREALGSFSGAQGNASGGLLPRGSR